MQQDQPGKPNGTRMLGLKIFLFVVVTSFLYPILFQPEHLVTNCPGADGGCVTRYGDALLPPLLGKVFITLIVVVWSGSLWRRGNRS